MNRIRDILKEKIAFGLKVARNLYGDYWLTLIVVMIGTIALAVGIEISFFSSEWMLMIGFWTCFLDINWKSIKKKLLLCIPGRFPPELLHGMIPIRHLELVVEK